MLSIRTPSTDLARRLHPWREIGVCLFRFGGVGGDGDLDVHSQVVGRKPRPGTMQRYRLARIAHHRDTNEVAVANDAIGWIEIDPTGSRQIDLRPGMRVAAARIASSSSGICRYPETKRAAIPRERTASIISIARSRQLPLPSSRVWRGTLNALLIPAHVLEGPIDSVGEVDQKLAGIGWPIPCAEMFASIARPGDPDRQTFVP